MRYNVLQTEGKRLHVSSSNLRVLSVTKDKALNSPAELSPWHSQRYRGTTTTKSWDKALNTWNDTPAMTTRSSSTEPNSMIEENT